MNHTPLGHNFVHQPPSSLPALHRWVAKPRAPSTPSLCSTPPVAAGNKRSSEGQPHPLRWHPWIPPGSLRTQEEPPHPSDKSKQPANISERELPSSSRQRRQQRALSTTATISNVVFRTRIFLELILKTCKEKKENSASPFSIFF